MAANRSVSRALQVLNLASEAERPMRLTEISDTLAIPKSTLHGILEALLEARYLRNGRDGTYALGVGVFVAGSAYLEGTDSRELIRPVLERLSTELEVTTHFAVLDGPQVLYLEKEDPPRQAVRLASAIGARLPAHLTAVGRACLSTLDREAALKHVDLELSVGEAAKMSLDELMADLDATSTRGYAVDDEWVLPGVVCVAAPVRDISGTHFGAIGVSYLKGSLAVEDVGAKLRTASQQVSELFGRTPSA